MPTRPKLRSLLRPTVLLQVFMATIIFLLLYVVSRSNYLLFHGIAEVSSIVVGFAVFAVGWNSHRFSASSFLLTLGIAHLFVGFIDLLHTFAYKGMGVFVGFDADLPTQLWIVARYLQSISLLIASITVKRVVNRWAVFGVYTTVTVLVLPTIFLRLFPQCYVEGYGLTPFKIVSEYIIIVILIAAALLYRFQREHLDQRLYQLLMLSMLMTVFAEFSFTLYTDVYGVFNVVGHYFKVVSFVCIYLAVVRGSLTRPYEILFRDLEASRQREAERAQTLERTNRELEAFAAAVSHDIKSPLHSIKMLTGLLTLQLDGSEALQQIREIESSADRIQDLVKDLLDLSRVGFKTVELTPVSLTVVFQEAAEVLRKQYPDRDVQMTIAPDMQVNADVGLIRLAVQNLLDNAWKFTAHSPSPSVVVGWEMQAGTRVFYVRDNGIGFDMSQVDRLFRPFERLHSAKEYSGTGIGLSIVERVIRAHHGRVWAQSTPGVGTVFYFTLHSERPQGLP
ncbi:MAG: hypothetical protein HXY34_07865 [Candidatus Thorarchaeota archaeon]|nr:hypothetical protein [Candidatus Thorarchaeota archaeon]